jgi:RNA polymerase sigma-70 factor, ECF subfamily
MPSHTDRPADDKRVRFEETALPWLDALYRVALRLTRQDSDAADLVQETCFRAYRTFENFRPGTNSRAWLFTIMYSIFINEQRRRGRQGVAVPIEVVDADASFDMPNEPAAVDAVTSVVVAGVAVGPEVARALAELRDEFRAVVLLVDAEGLSYEDAAAVLQCPVGTVRSRLFRARRQLAAALRAYTARSGFDGGDS